MSNILSNHISDGAGQEGVIWAGEPDQPSAADWMVHGLPIALSSIFVSIGRTEDVEWLQRIWVFIRILFKEMARFICALLTGVVNAIVKGGITDSLHTGVAMAV